MPVHRVKRVDFLGRTVPVLLQNENGPCPLLAICNGLLLRGSIRLPAGRMEVVTDELVQLVANRLFEGNAAALTSSTAAVAANAQKSVDDVIAILPDFAVGLDVNVRFDKVDSFEFTRQLATFDLSGMRLLHGWTYDPQDTRVASAVGKLSYNQLIERVITLRSATTTAAEGKQPTAAPAATTPASTVASVVGGGAGHSAGDDGATLDDAIALSRGVSEPHEATLVTESKAGEPAGVATVVATTLTSATEGEGKGPGEGPAAGAAGGKSGSAGVVADAAAVVVVGKARSASDHAQDFGTLAALEDFLDGTRTQLSYHGLAELHAFVRENELAVFFRNNHFSTLFKHEGQLYLLLTDIGFEHRPAHVWERLTEIDGDTCCCDATFRRSPTVSAAPPRAAAAGGGKDDADYLLAMQLQHGGGGAGGGGGGGGGATAAVTGTVVGVGGGGGAHQVATAAAVVTPSARQSGWEQGTDVAAQQRELARLKQAHTERKRQEEARAAKKKKKKGGCAIM